MHWGMVKSMPLVVSLWCVRSCAYVLAAHADDTQHSRSHARVPHYTPASFFRTHFCQRLLSARSTLCLTYLHVSYDLLQEILAEVARIRGQAPAAPGAPTAAPAAAPAPAAAAPAAPAPAAAGAPAAAPAAAAPAPTAAKPVAAAPAAAAVPAATGKGAEKKEEIRVEEKDEIKAEKKEEAKAEAEKVPVGAKA